MLDFYYRMELIHLLINSVKTGICFLCFKENENMQNIHEELEVEGQLLSGTLSLVDMINYLFPSFELTLTKACEECTELLIKMYITIHKNNIMKKIMNRLINAFNNELNKASISTLDGFRNYSININLNKITDVKNQPIKMYKAISNDNDVCSDKISNNSVEEDFSNDKQCPYCYKLFDSIKKLKNHMKNHTRKRKKIYHSCNQCKYKSLCKESLQGHINKSHLKTRPHVCKICYKNFYHKKNLIEHETSHESARSGICEICGDGFIHRKNLIEHLKLHSGEKPYNCDICAKRFITSGRRLEHVKRCHSVKNECCLLCDKKFSLVKELTRHMKTVHS